MSYGSSIRPLKTKSRSLAETARDDKNWGVNVLPAGSSDGQPVHFQCWNPNADWHRLSILAAGADALIELQVAAHHRNFGQHIRPVANQRRVLQRRSNDAVLDQ